MKKRGILSCLVIALMLFSTSAGYAASNVEAGTEGVIQSVQRIEQDLTSDPTNPCIRIEGIATYKDARVLAEVYRENNTLVGSGDHILQSADEGNFSVPIYIWLGGLEDGNYYAVLADENHGINSSIDNRELKTEGKGTTTSYRIYFSMKDGLVQGEWKPNTKPSDQAENKEPQTTGGGILFNDLQDHWAKKSIDQLIGLGVVSGYEDGTFRPNSTITRAEFAQIIQGVFQFDQSENVFPFMDVPNNSWYSNSVKTLYGNGIIAGISDTAFAPQENITREQMAAILSRAVERKSIELEEKKEALEFKDINKISSYARSAVMDFYKGGIISGFISENGETEFRPQSKATRAETSVMLVNLMEEAGI